MAPHRTVLPAAINPDMYPILANATEAVIDGITADFIDPDNAYQVRVNETAVKLWQQHGPLSREFLMPAVGYVLDLTIATFDTEAVAEMLPNKVEERSKIIRGYAGYIATRLKEVGELKKIYRNNETLASALTPSNLATLTNQKNENLPHFCSTAVYLVSLSGAGALGHLLEQGYEEDPIDMVTSSQELPTLSQLNGFGEARVVNRSLRYHGYLPTEDFMIKDSDAGATIGYSASFKRLMRPYIRQGSICPAAVVKEYDDPQSPTMVERYFGSLAYQLLGNNPDVSVAVSPQAAPQIGVIRLSNGRRSMFLRPQSLRPPVRPGSH